jgi:hypothetical protein
MKNAASGLPLIRSKTDLVEPQAGQGRPVVIFKIQIELALIVLTSITYSTHAYAVTRAEIISR